MMAIWLVIGSLYGALGVGLGAFGAHALRERLTLERRETYETAVCYQLWHVPALLATAWAAAQLPGSALGERGRLALQPGCAAVFGQLVPAAVERAAALGRGDPAGWSGADRRLALPGRRSIDRALTGASQVILKPIT